MSGILCGKSTARLAESGRFGECSRIIWRSEFEAWSLADRSGLRAVHAVQTREPVDHPQNNAQIAGMRFVRVADDNEIRCGGQRQTNPRDHC